MRFTNRTRCCVGFLAAPLEEDSALEGLAQAPTPRTNRRDTPFIFSLDRDESGQ